MMIDKKSPASPEQSGSVSVDDVINARMDKIALRRSIIALIIKIIAFALAAFIVLRFLFGVGIVSGEGMYPRMRDGDLVIYYRLEESYDIGEIAVFTIDDEIIYGRIVAKGSDTVDMTSDGQLIVNGSIQQEEIFFPTMKSDSQAEFPLTLDDNEIFVLGDNRTAASDSREFGAVKLSDVSGKVITLIRRRGL